MLLDDAEMETVIPEFIGQLMSNTGQSCNALSRMLVPESEYERAVAIAKAATEQVLMTRSSRAIIHNPYL
jgi:aldehyde dehydrogenase (NAD+)